MNTNFLKDLNFVECPGWVHMEHFFMSLKTRVITEGFRGFQPSLSVVSEKG